MDGGEGNGSLRFDIEDYLDAVGAGSGSASSEAPILAVGGPSRGRGSGSIQMYGDEDSLRFDFEDDVDAAGAGTGSSAWPFEAPIPAAGGPSHGPGSGSIQMDGDESSLRFDFDLDAVGAGSGSDEEIPECIMFSVGFCPNGPNCKCMHVKLPGPPPVEEVLQEFQQTNAYNYGSSSRTYQPRDNNCKQKAIPQVQHGSVLKNQNLAVNATLVAQQPAAQHVQTANPPPHLQQQQNSQIQGVHNGSSIQKLPQLQAHFHKDNQGTRLLKVATRRIWVLVQWGVCASQKGLMRLNLTKHLSPWRESFQYSPSLELIISSVCRTSRAGGGI